MRTSVNQGCLVIVAIAAGILLLQQTSYILVPVVAALTLGIVMTPVSDLWDRLRIPNAPAAFLTMLFAVAIIFAVILLIEPYVTLAIEQAPIIRAELRDTVFEARRLLRGLEAISEDMATAIEPGAGAAGDEDTVTVPSLTDALFYAPQFMARLLIFVGTLYFFLLVRTDIYDGLSRNIKPLAKSDLRLAAKQVSRYVLTIAAINASFGVVIALAMQIIGMPTPVIWGILACLLNFMLYLGPATLAVALTIAGIVAFDGAASFLPVAIYVTLNAIEAQFVTPALVGRNLSVNPLLVFLSLVFWLWIWGPVGGIIAIPILIWTMTVLRGAAGQTISAGAPGK
ncbi:AI-2E family transporter [Yoonia sp. R2331]|uniref:AI-2E family transporter n=1 Tax=Yoonia sp. R2331 TaxID=3237238 RepID=UPI0034E3CEC2